MPSTPERGGSPGFVHLRLHTEYSLVDGIVRVPRLMPAVAAAGMPAVALTDHGNLFAMVKFHREAERSGVKPVIGADLWIAGDGERAEPTLLTLLAKDADGFRNLARLVSRWNEPGRGDRRLLALLRGHRMKRVLRRMLDESEFLSPFGIRAMSRHHDGAPYRFRHGGLDLTVDYQPAESSNRLFGGNSNWRGPIWFPPNYLIIESLRRFHRYYGPEFKVECPTGSGNYSSLDEIADELALRLTRIFLPDASGKRPVYGHSPRMQDDPHFRDHLQFYEYFHGDTGRGVGASHQTGWTGLVADLLTTKR